MTLMQASKPEYRLENWEGYSLARLGDYSNLGRRPWSELRQIEFLPGVRVGDDAYIMPRYWLPPGSRRDNHRTLELTSRYATVPISASDAWAENLRRTLVGILLPQQTKSGVKEPAASTWLTYSYLILRMADWVSHHRMGEGAIWSHLSDRDWEALRKSMRQRRRDNVGQIAGRIADLGRRGILLDYPRSSTQMSPRPYAIVDVIQEPIVEASHRGRQKPSTEPDGAVSRRIHPFPDAFVTAVIGRARWIQDNLADQLLSCWAESRSIIADAAQLGRANAHRDVAEERIRLVTERQWLDAEGRPLVTLPWPILMADGVLSEGGKITSMQTTWPPRRLRSINMMVGLLQALNFCVVAFCAGARVSEILSAADDALDRGGDRLRARTFKLHDELEGIERDWPLHPAAIRAIELQTDLARIVRGPDGHHIWVLINDGSDPAGSEIHDVNEPLSSMVRKLGLEDLLGDERPHTHRWRHSVARLVALAVVSAPQVLMDLFGHRDLAMTFNYILSNPEIANEALKVADEMAHVLGVEAASEVEAGMASGPAAAVLAAGLERLRMVRGEDRLEASTMREAVDILTFNGRQWQMVRPGVLCTKGLGQFGPCSKGRGEPDPGACRTDCGHRLELARAKSHCEEAIRQLLDEHEAARVDGLDMVVASLEGQIAANLQRWAEVRERILADRPEAARIWNDLVRPEPTA